VVTPHQQLTHEWWGHHRPQLEAYISTLVIQEAEAGDTSSVAKGRLEAIEDFPVLELNEDVLNPAKSLVETGPIPAEFGVGPLQPAQGFSIDFLFLGTNNRPVT
jgi:hypothetical protein